MTKITLMGCVVAVAASATLSADTAVTTAAFTPNADGTVSVTYTLAGDEPAVVTMDARIGGASIEAGGRFVRRVTGDVNRIVVPGEHAIVWHAREDLGASPGDLSDFAVTVSPVSRIASIRNTARNRFILKDPPSSFRPERI